MGSNISLERFVYPFIYLFIYLVCFCSLQREPERQRWGTSSLQMHALPSPRFMCKTPACLQLLPLLSPSPELLPSCAYTLRTHLVVLLLLFLLYYIPIHHDPTMVPLNRITNYLSLLCFPLTLSLSLFLFFFFGLLLWIFPLTPNISLHPPTILYSILKIGVLSLHLRYLLSI